MLCKKLNQEIKSYIKCIVFTKAFEWDVFREKALHLNA